MNMYEQYLKFYPGFPKEGVNFVDIIPLMQDKDVFRNLIHDLADQCAAPNIAAPEARGFLFAAPMLTECPQIANVIPIRKSGKLPFKEGDLVGVEYMKEYGPDKLFFRPSDVAAGKMDPDGVFRVTLFDDILATGGTGSAVAEGLNKTVITIDGQPHRIEVTDFVFLVEIDGLGGREKLEALAPVKSLMHLSD